MMAASAEYFMINVSVPRLAYSSSATQAKMMSPLSLMPDSTIDFTAVICAARPLFMSSAPLPYTLPFSDLGSRGAMSILSMLTVSE